MIDQDSIGEDELIDRILRGNPLTDTVKVGPGDDCAVVTYDDQNDLLLKTDCVVESIHFTPGTDPIRVGWKALSRAISDIAAMGGTPDYALVTLAIDRDRKLEEVEGWYKGIRKAAKAFSNISIVGGETTSLPQKGAIISISLTGRVKKNQALLRSGAKPDDIIFVTGRLGGSFKSGRHLDFTPRLREAHWLANLPNKSRPTAMMDLSDGLAKDLPRLADQSGQLGYKIDLDSIPKNSDCDLAQAIGEGEDYELLFTAPDVSILSDWEDNVSDVPLNAIGKLTSQNEPRTTMDGGWDHLRPNSKGAGLDG